MTKITTHVLDTAAGRPAAGIAVRLEYAAAEGWREIGTGETDTDGRCGPLAPEGLDLEGVCRLLFGVGDYFAPRGTESLYDRIVVEFRVTAGEDAYHVPVLLSPFGYSTYRGS